MTWCVNDVDFDALRANENLQDSLATAAEGNNFDKSQRSSRMWDEWSVHLIADSCVLGQDGNTALALDVIAVHDSFLCMLIGSEDFALLKHRVHLHKPRAKL